MSAQLLSGSNVMHVTAGTVQLAKIWRVNPQLNYIFVGFVVKNDIPVKLLERGGVDEI